MAIGRRQAGFDRTRPQAATVDRAADSGNYTLILPSAVSLSCRILPITQSRDLSTLLETSRFQPTPERSALAARPMCSHRVGPTNSKIRDYPDQP